MGESKVDDHIAKFLWQVIECLGRNFFGNAKQWFCDAAGDCCDGVTVATDRDRVANCVFKAIRCQRADQSNRNRTLASFIKAILRSDKRFP